MGDQTAKKVSVVSASILTAGLVFGGGIYAGLRDLPPVPQLREARAAVTGVFSSEDEEFFESETVPAEEPIQELLPTSVAPGLVMVARNVEPRVTTVSVLDRDGEIVHELTPRWGEMWPDGEGDFPERPAESTYLHGVRMLEDGSIVANFDEQSTFRMDLCGNVMWKLDNLGHHSVTVDPDENIWVPVVDWTFEGGQTGFPNVVPRYMGYGMQELTPDGEELRRVSMEQILFDNDLEGLLYATSTRSKAPIVRGDALHLNSVVRFPEGMPSDYFEPGDLLVSMRNIQTMLVLDGETMEVKWQSSGQVVRQHDPEFLDGDTISVFDNDPVGPEGERTSKIVEIEVEDNTLTTVLDGATTDPGFYTEIMGTHQRLENGNILFVPADEGVVLEFTPEGELAWQYDNRIRENVNGRIQNAEVLPESMDEQFFEKGTASCQS